MDKQGGQPLNLQIAADGSSALSRFMTPSKPTLLERFLLRQTLSALGNPPVDIVSSDGEIIWSSGEAAIARIWLRNRKAIVGLLRGSELHVGDAYSLGHIDIDGDLVGFLEAIYRGQDQFNVKHPLRARLQQRLSEPRANTLASSRQHIQHHYDLGNTFYQHWLDRQMIYTCAYFSAPDMTLEAAQINKMDYVCRKLRLRPGQTVIEAGCGWGALARHMAKHYGVKVKAFNISREQIQYAREQARQEGLHGSVEFIEDDYRSVQGQFDAFVSVGMLEHVGKAHYAALGQVIHRCLNSTGRGLLHSIGRNTPTPLSVWIERRIFPGAYPPSLVEMLQILEPFGFSILDVENLRLHYAKTLEHWLARFERAAEDIRNEFDDYFVRAWRLYLSGSLAGFSAGTLQLFQVVFARQNNNDLPLTREHLYQ